MVMGISASSPQGHVAYVEAINPNGSFLISEMNWWGVPGGGWGRVDFRTMTSMRGILGFIY
jgi:surface antigen